MTVQVCWLYNIRGTDVAYSPVVHAFAIVTLNSAFFYVDKRKVSSEVSQLICIYFHHLLNQPSYGGEYWFKFELIKTLVIIDVFTIGLHQIMYLITVTSIKTVEQSSDVL